MPKAEMNLKELPTLMSQAHKLIKSKASTPISKEEDLNSKDKNKPFLDILKIV